MIIAIGGLCTILFEEYLLKRSLYRRFLFLKGERCYLIQRNQVFNAKTLNLSVNIGKSYLPDVISSEELKTFKIMMEKSNADFEEFQ